MTVRRTLWLSFAAFIVYGATVPFAWVADAGSILDNLRRLPLNPFVSPQTGLGVSVTDLIQNVLLFLPFGALGFLSGDPARPARARIAFVTVAGFALSAGVECLQLLTVDRVPSLGDIVADTAGCVLGAGLAWRFRGRLGAGFRALRSAGVVDAPELRTLAIAVIALLIAWWQPFDLTLDINSLSNKALQLREDLWHFRGWHYAGTSLMLSAFLAMALASYLSILGERHAGTKATALGAGLLCLLEFGQSFIGSRMPGLGEPLLASAGVAIGAAIWSMAGRIAWPGLWLGILAAMTMAAAALWLFFPTAPAATTLEAVRRLVEFALLFFPLGFWVGQAGPDRLRALARGFALVLAMAALSWMLQAFLLSQRPDATVIGVSLVGVALGIRAGLPQT